MSTLEEPTPDGIWCHVNYWMQWNEFQYAWYLSRVSGIILGSLLADYAKLSSLMCIKHYKQNI